MKNLQKILSILFLLFFIFTAPSCADIKSVKISSDDRGLIDFHKFEFTNTGQLSVSISSVSVSSMPVTSNLSRPDLSRIGFFLVSDYALHYMIDEHSCYLDSKYISLLFTFQDISPPSQCSFNKSYAVTYPNSYTLTFANCNPLSHVTMDVKAEFYNTHNGTTKDYLPAGQTKLPSLYFKLSVIYLCSLAFWISICFKNYPSFHWIHLLMGVLLLMKGLNLLSAAKVQHSIKVTGTPLHGWNVLLYIFQFIRTVLFYTVIAATIDGCWFLKPIILINNSLMIVIPLQFFATIASKVACEVLLEESLLWDIGSLFADSICKTLFIVLIGFAVYWSSEADEAVKNYSAKFSLIRVFYFVFILCSCVDYVCGIVGSDWAMAKEIASLVLYMVMFSLFMPSEKSEYFVPPASEGLVGDVELGCGV
ncbi:protein CANDIDATE G-PROTEIN COUPLED RECEPTOR 7 [Lactuca sativa]|uniref:protein CANDIDATE G-PROTEIN COUPLED RECEPTOR 7 n=1 Tax=Lactuca sativa TaxID=4236 RepID=UPI000CBA6689|nr:protein CANDIDATE G-PROTEIN COUPLED RECEPTOR 7 [Lactuca sativa]